MGVFSHFSTGETKESPTAYRQFQLYQQALAQLQAAGIDPLQKHMCNSGGSDWFRASFCNAVRIGRRLYMDNQAEPLTPGTPGAGAGGMQLARLGNEPARCGGRRYCGI